MIIQSKNQSGILGRISLRFVLIIPFVVILVLTVGLVGYLSFRNGQQAVNDVAIQLRLEITARIEERLQNYLKLAHIASQTLHDELELGDMSPDDFANLEPRIWQTLDRFETIFIISYGNEKNEFLSVNRADGTIPRAVSFSTEKNQRTFEAYTVDEQNKPIKLFASFPNYDPRVRPWYQLAKQHRQTVLTPVYLWTSRILGLDLTTPIYDSAQALKGVFAVSLTLTNINEFLGSLKIGQTGVTFIMERSGLLVASSTTELPFVTNKNTKADSRLSALDSTEPLICLTTHALVDQLGDLTSITDSQSLKFNINSAPHFVQVTPFKDDAGLDWLIVVVIPESDFMTQIEESNRLTIALILFALLVAMGVGTLTARWVTQPILTLNSSAKRLADGEWGERVNLERHDEVGQLGQSFNHMADQLQDIFETLERRVMERTNELVQTNEQLQIAKMKADAANQAKSDFLSAMSHELRTPLNGILGYAQILRRKHDLDTDMLKGLNIIYQSGSHLLTLINDILDLSKVEARKMELHPESVNLTAFLESVVGIIYMRAQEKELEFKQEFKSLPAGVMVDEKRLRQILLNLLGNAVKFTVKGAVILRVSQVANGRIGEDANGRIIRFEVEDSGVGIAADQLEKIFQPFEQSGNIKQRAEGTGLGLTISRQLVELMGGTIQVKSELGQGSLFWFELTLPLSMVSETVVKAVQRVNQVVGYQGDRRRLLVVDDEPSNRHLLRVLLEPLGFEIVEAENGSMAFQLTLQFRPDLIITDMVMPIMSGFELIQKIRAMPDLATHVIVVSASSFDLRQNLVGSYDGYLSKPIDIDKLLELIGQTLQLTWLYQVEVIKEETEIKAILPYSELEELHQYATEGNMRKVRQKGEALLGQFGVEYHPFIKQLLALARGYEEKKLLALLNQYF